MPRPSRPWFRFYVEAVRDRKLRRLPPAQRWLWVAVLSAARESCIHGHLMVSVRERMEVDDLADYAGMPAKDVAAGLERFEASEMIRRSSDIGCWEVINWSERQYESDNSTVRTRKHRSQEQGGNVPTPSLGTPPETEAETDTSLVPPEPLDRRIPPEVIEQGMTAVASIRSLLAPEPAVANGSHGSLGET